MVRESRKRKRIPALVVEGLAFPFYFDEEKIRQTIFFKAEAYDIFIVTYPKCGTTWMRYIVWSIQNHGKLPLPSMDDLSYNIAPYLERAGSLVANDLPAPRTLSVHTTFQLTAAHPKARYIYVARDPRDACVSYYHFCKDSLGGKEYRDVTFDEFFEEFVRGEVPYGDFFDHVKDWWHRRSDHNVLFTTYEAMQEDARSVVLQVARFISDEENDYEAMLLQDQENILNKVIENTSFGQMKRNIPVVIKRATDESCGDTTLDAGVKVDFFRKGIVGDWINYFSQEQIERLKERQTEKVSGSGLEDLWIYE